MKAAISIPDELFASADRLARKLGFSRSGLYAIAVAEFVAKHRGENITRRLNEVYRDEPQRSDPALRRLQKRALQREPW